MPEPPPRLVLTNEGYLRQGEILRGVPLFSLARPYREGESARFVGRDAPYCIVLTQDCDLQQSHYASTREPHPESGKVTKSHNLLWSILLAPGWEKSVVEEYKHLRGDAYTDLDSMPKMRGREAELVQQNRNERYYFVESSPPLLSEDVIFDFKLAIGLTSEYLDEALNDFGVERIAKLGDPWTQHLAHRYISYLGRVALPGAD